MRDLEGVVSLCACMAFLIVGIVLIYVDPEIELEEVNWLGLTAFAIGLIAWRAGIRRK